MNTINGSSLPAHSRPSEVSAYPSLHLQKKVPTVFKHSPFRHKPLCIAHSSMSDQCTNTMHHTKAAALSHLSL